MKLNRNTIIDSQLAQWIKGFSSSNIVARFIATVVVWAIVTCPISCYIIVRIFTAPAGFWQELTLLIVFCVLLGWLQVILLFFGIIITMFILTEQF